MMKEMRKNGENLVKFLNSRHQDSEPVVTMMTKLNKAWDEFQEKLELTKDAVNGNKTLPQVRASLFLIMLSYTMICCAVLTMLRCAVLGCGVICCDIMCCSVL